MKKIRTGSKILLACALGALVSCGTSLQTHDQENNVATTLSKAIPAEKKPKIKLTNYNGPALKDSELRKMIPNYDSAIDVEIIFPTKGDAPSITEYQGVGAQAYGCSWDNDGDGRCEEPRTDSLVAFKTSEYVDYNVVDITRYKCLAGSSCQATVKETKSGTVTGNISASYPTPVQATIGTSASYSITWTVEQGLSTTLAYNECAEYKVYEYVDRYMGDYRADFYESDAWYNRHYVGNYVVGSTWYAKTAKHVTRGWFRC